METNTINVRAVMDALLQSSSNDVCCRRYALDGDSLPSCCGNMLGNAELAAASAAVSELVEAAISAAERLDESGRSSKRLREALAKFA